MADLQLSDELYLLYRDLLLKRVGLYYPPHKRDDLAHGLSLAMKTTGHSTLLQLLADIAEANDVWEVVLAHLTIGETSFFRNQPQFQALREHIFPELLQRHATLKSIRIWSAGCATGEEPYSLAMLLKEIQPNLNEWHVGLLATDINPTFLARARAGYYGNWSFREIPDDVKARYFTQEKTNQWRLSAEIRAMVTFARLNLVEDTYPSITNGTTSLDMILCRNVTIYFDETTIRHVVERFYRALAPGGWLIVGHSEPHAGIYHQFDVHNFPNTVIYRKQVNAPLFVVNTPPSFFSNTPETATNTALASITTPPTSWQKPSSSSIEPNTKTQSVVHAVATPSATPTPSLTSLATSSATKTIPLWTKYAASSDTHNLSVDELWRTVQRSLTTNNKERAEQTLRELITRQPDHVDGLIALGRICADRGEWACARFHCEAALKYVPLSIEAHYMLAQICEHEGQYDDALSSYRRVVYLDRRFVLGIIGMANVWRQLGRFDEARRSYRNVLKQLAHMSPSAVIPGSEGATASELASFATRQLQSLR